MLLDTPRQLLTIHEKLITFMWNIYFLRFNLLYVSVIDKNEKCGQEQVGGQLDWIKLLMVWMVSLCSILFEVK